MKKLLLLLAATNCCYFHANAGTYLTLSATSLLKPSASASKPSASKPSASKPSASDSAKSVIDDINSVPLPSISIGYDVFFSNFYIAFEQSIIPLGLLNMKLSAFKEDVSFVQLGYKIMDNVVLFVTGGFSLYGLKPDASLHRSQDASPHGNQDASPHGNKKYDNPDLCACFGVGVKYFTSNNNLVYRAMWQHVTWSNFNLKAKAFILGVDYRI